MDNKPQAPKMEWYGSVSNRMSACAVKGAPTPVVGMGATELCFSDRHAHTIVSVEKYRGKDAGRIGVQQDHAKRTDSNGMSESQTYEYTPNTEGGVEYYTLRKTGQYVRDGESLKGGTVLAVGYRDEYYDYTK